MRPKAPPKRSRPRCNGKVRFRSPYEAQSVIAASRRSGKDYVPVRTYPCPLCHGHHLSSKR